jgi:HEAT repeat protein
MTTIMSVVPTTDQYPLPSWLRSALASRLTGADAAEALLRLAGDAIRVKDTESVMRHASAITPLAAPAAVDYLLNCARDRTAGVATLALALRLAGPAVADAVLGRLNADDDTSARHSYTLLAGALAKYPELRAAMILRLETDLNSAQWYVVRNALVMLPEIGADIAPRHDLATHAHRQVRLALVKMLARRECEPNVLDSLVFLLGDPDAGVRFATVVALGAADTPRANMALQLHVPTETDIETQQACRAAIKRRSNTERMIA